MSKQTKENQGKIKSLISVSPKLYRFITTNLADKYHIHSYDIQVGAVEKEKGIHIYLKYGEHFTYEKEQFFTTEMLEDEKALEAFIDEVGDTCKEAMIEDYFNRMTP